VRPLSHLSQAHSREDKILVSETLHSHRECENEKRSTSPPIHSDFITMGQGVCEQQRTSSTVRTRGKPTRLQRLSPVQALHTEYREELG
jgi:hypothetical protein